MQRSSAPASVRVSSSQWAALSALAIGYAMILVDATAMSVVTRPLMHALHADVRTSLWVSSAYLVAFAVPMLVCGRLGDRFGHRRVYVAGLGLFVAASLGCGLSGTIEVLVAFRVAQGLGAAMMTPQVMSIITLVFPFEVRGAALGVWGSVTGVATLVGPVVGGLLTDLAGWHWVFWINVPVGIVGVVLALRSVPRSQTSPEPVDLVGAALSLVAVCGIVVGLQRLGDVGVAPSVTLVVGLACAGLLVWWIRLRGDRAIIPARLFRIRSFTASSTVNMLAGAWVTAYVFPATLYAQEVRGMSPSEAAALLAPTALVSAVLAPRVGRALRTRSPRRVLAAGLAVSTGGLALFLIVISTGLPVLWMAAPAAVVGLGSAMMWGPMSLLATSDLPRDLVGAGSGVFNTTRQLGSAVGAAAVAAVLASASLPLGMLLAAVLCAAALAATLGFGTDPRPASRSAAG